MQTIMQILNSNDFESIAVLKELNLAHRYLGELKGLCKSTPNQNILIDTLTLQEAQDSSEIENIITTKDEVFKHKLQPKITNIAAKEVSNYVHALNYCYQELRSNQKILSMGTILGAQKIIKGNEAGLRKLPGTVLKNELTQKIIYTPPSPEKLDDLLKELEIFINDGALSALDPLIKMAIIHHQFESIHPFYDGNGRIGRIINIIYLVQQGLLDLPILYLSRYINHNKQRYYYLLQTVREKNTWQEWVIFMLRAVQKTAKHGITLINDIVQLQKRCKHIIRTRHAKIYSQELLNNIFKHPYTKIAFLQHDISSSRSTAGRYLEQLVDSGLLHQQKFGRENYYFNDELIALLSDVTSMEENN